MNKAGGYTEPHSSLKQQFVGRAILTSQNQAAVYLQFSALWKVLLPVPESVVCHVRELLLWGAVPHFCSAGVRAHSKASFCSLLLVSAVAPA